MKALVFERNLPRYAMARVAGELSPGRGARYGPLSLDDVAAPTLPGPGWQRVRPRLSGICGSDLSTIDGRSSRYFEPIVSFPFTPGHEVVGDLDDGTRVVVEPVLGCVARGIDPPCVQCTQGHLGNCERLAFGCLEPGLQTGFCTSTGGGWSVAMSAHQSQLHPVPDAMADEDAVMVEPTACGVHAALAAGAGLGVVAVIGAGTLGLAAVAALRRWCPPGTLAVGAKHPEQRRWARELGADVVAQPGELARVVRSLTGSMAYGNQLTGGADCVLDCVGSADSVQQALAMVRPRGRVLVVGMPGGVKLDLTGLWHREVALTGVYAYGTEALPGGHQRRTFDLAFELVRAAGLGRLVSHAYPLSRYRDALTHAAQAGRRGATKVVFDLRHEKERNR